MKNDVITPFYGIVMVDDDVVEEDLFSLRIANLVTLDLLKPLSGSTRSLKFDLG